MGKKKKKSLMAQEGTVMEEGFSVDTKPRQT